MKMSVLFRGSASVCHSVFPLQAEDECICLDVKSFEYAKSFKYASLQAAAHGWMQQLRFLFSNNARHQMEMYSCLKHLQAASILPLAHGRPRLPFQAGYSTRKQWNGAKAHSITPKSSRSTIQSHMKRLTLVYLSRERIF